MLNADETKSEDGAAPLQELPEGHRMHRVAMVVFCEASGYDDMDAAATARMALTATLRKAGAADPTLPSATPPSCAVCGARAQVTKVGVMKRHHLGEEDFIDDSDHGPCDGSGKPPRVRDEPVLTVEYRNGHVMQARIFDTVEAGMAAGNGYLWTKPTPRAFR